MFKPYLKDISKVASLGDAREESYYSILEGLLKSSDLHPPISRFQGKGNNQVDKLRYDKSESRVYFNQNHYFEGILNEVWEYQIGGYQVCHKWLKDRKGRLLSTDDIKHYCSLATAIHNTIKIQKEIDRIYPEVEINTISFD
jgi:hypothetical protein